MSKKLTVQDILSKATPGPTKLYIPEWDGNVYVKTFTVKERDALERLAMDRKQQKTLRARIFIAALVDEAGNQQFTIRQIETVAELPAGPVSRVVEKAMELSGMSPQEVEEAVEGFGEALGADDSSA